MKVEKMRDVLFSAFTAAIALIAVIPLSAPIAFGNIWSWEGFFQSQASVSKWLAFCGAEILLILPLLLAVHIPGLGWKILRNRKVSLNIKLILGEKTISLFQLKPLDQKLKLTFGKKARSIFLWKRFGKLRWGLLCIAAAVSLTVFLRDIPQTARWFEKYDLVAHAGGTSPNGHACANSLEAFESSYQQGFRVFEGDFCLTSDGVLVLEHDWAAWCGKIGMEYTGQPPTYERFIATKLYDAETPMDLPSLMDMMIRHEDMYFMTDFKYCYDENDVISGFQQIAQAAKDVGRLDILDRFIIQNHHNQFKHWVDSVYPFENWLYTCYSIRSAEENIPENLVAYCEMEHIPVITMWYMPDDAWFKLTQPHNIRIFVHTVNDTAYANELISAGVAGIYTDVKLF